MRPGPSVDLSFSLASWSRWALHRLLWVEAHVLVWSTLTQAAYLALLLIPFRIAMRRGVPWLEQESQRLSPGHLRRLAQALAAVAPWIGFVVLVWFGQVGFHAAALDADLLRLASSCAFAWVVIRLSSSLLSDPRLARAVAVLAWVVAALNILGLLDPATHLLDSMALTVGTFRLSLLLVLKAAVLLSVLIWLANAVSRLVEQRLRREQHITPAMQVLATKLTRISLLTLAIVLSLGAIGINLTAFAVFSGAIGVGVGFGLQRVVSNLVSGVILLLDRSIKPGDVIELAGTYGWISGLNARYVSVVTRDGTEYLIPNEDLITQRVVNWSYSNDLVRLKVKLGVSYNADLREAMRLGLEAVDATPRVLKQPKPVCLLTEFGDSSVNLELRFWISDPRSGTANVRSDVMLNVWDRYKAAGIELPFPQRDLNIRDIGPAAAQFAEALGARRDATLAPEHRTDPALSA